MVLTRVVDPENQVQSPQVLSLDLLIKIFAGRPTCRGVHEACPLVQAYLSKFKTKIGS